MRLAFATLLLLAIGTAWAADQKLAFHPIAVDVRMAKAKNKVSLIFLGRNADGHVICCQPRNRKATTVLRPESISRIRFAFVYDERQVALLRRQGRWTEAATLMAKAVAPALPYLDVARNNGVSLAMRTGNYLMRGGDIKVRFAATPEERQAAQVEFNAALQILRAAARAEWSSRSAEAQLRAGMCLVFLNQLDAAGKLFEEVAEPDVDVDEYGVYQLARAYYLAAKGEWQEAIEAAVHSSDFETKDIDTFPAALLLAGHCYEKLDEWYRARDVYYEVARLFGRTPWGVVAKERLRRILDQGLTAKDESVAAKNVFFGLEEDINAKARDLLGLDENGKPKGEAKKPADK
jgi:tetratricopeptide (TPR) repeat protein